MKIRKIYILSKREDFFHQNNTTKIVRMRKTNKKYNFMYV
ncbi:hypothetical protein RUMOBE_02328 [Blautia obeum ATCC 29174]|uniref:Uncharacterized protein n=1 Tax=Blautia obeum ATCC 29174 TaxID=411459 RepID=A5ZTJ9_9FIRM|nr:hypothetical protein RUMOBE_02328 [Blautia obeum ATCC 29174]